MIDSLRRWGGRLADAPVYAVKPRRGMPLTRQTRRRFDELNVHFLDIKPKTPYAWFRFLNKPLAMMEVEHRVDSEQMIWLDGDIIVAREPTDIVLRDGEDFTACASDKNVGTTGPGDKFEPFWVEMAKVYGYSVDDLPWVKDERTGEPIRLYWNSGVFTYRRHDGFARHWHDGTIKLLEAKLAFKEGELIFHEQIALGMVMLQMGLKYRAFGSLCNLPIGKILKHDPVAFREAAILHYHGCLWPDFFDQFCAYCKADRPDIYAWLAPQGPIGYAPSIPIKAVKKVLDDYRKRKWNRFKAECRHL